MREVVVPRAGDSPSRKTAASILATPFRRVGQDSILSPALTETEISVSRLCRSSQTFLAASGIGSRRSTVVTTLLISTSIILIHKTDLLHQELAAFRF